MTGVVAPLASPLLSGLTDVRGWCPSTATSSRTFGQHALLKRKARRARTVRLPVRQGEPAGCAVRFFHSPRAEILVAVVRLAVSGLVEEIVGRVRHKRQMPDVCATPPEVFSRWMKVVFVRVSPPVGPFSVLATVTLSQGMAFGATKARSEEESPVFTKPQTVLVSRECCHVTRIGPTATTAGFVLFSNGSGLKKWVVSCFSSSLNRVASGVKST